MIRFAFDSETFPIRPGRQAPRVVCVQSAIEGRDRRIDLREEGLDRLEAALAGPEFLIIGHNVAFDAAASIATRPRLLRPWFEAYEADRVVCTQVRERLARIAQGTADRFPKHGLLDCLDRYGIDHDLTKDDKSSPDAWRTRYAELDGIPVAEWPEEARRYALADLSVDDLYLAQEAAFGEAGIFVDQFRQARKDFWLYLQVCSGMRTDPEAVEAFGRKVEIEHAAAQAVLQAAGLVRADGSKDTKKARARMRAVCRERGLTVPLTKTGKQKVREEVLTRAAAAEGDYVALDADACKAAADPLLVSYARYTSVGTLRGRVERLRLAGDLPIQPRFDCLKKTGRTSCSMGDVKPGKPLWAFGDQVQNLHREPGLRECYRAREGFVLFSVDWSAAELHSLAQVCTWLGLDSRLARVLNQGRDPHLHFACQAMGWDYEWAWANRKDPRVKEARQAAKAYNFGFPGGLGIEKFRLFAAKTYGVILDDTQAREGREAWFATYPEMIGYFDHINELLELDRPLIHFKSERWRGDLRYTAAANSYFQGHTADMAGEAGWRLAREYYGVDSSVLAAARPWNFVHDEFIGEAPESIAHECALRCQTVMEDVGRIWCPDVPVRAEPALSRSWRKGAEPTYQDGRLVPWEDRTMNEDETSSLKKELAGGADPWHLSWEFGRDVAVIEDMRRAV